MSSLFIFFILLTFDLDQSKLAKFYPGSSTNYAYTQIGTFLKKNGFEHNQGSGYVSTEPMWISKAITISKNLQKKFPWLNKVVSIFEVTEVNEISFDLRATLDTVAEEQQKLSKRKSHTPSR